MTDRAPPRWLALALQHRAVPVALAALYVLLAARSLAADRALYDEGLLTWIFAAWTALDPLPTLFLQKSRPVASLAYALPAALGLGAFYAVHVAVSALAIPLLARVGAALGLRAPNLPALALALSPIYLAGGPSGLTNNDGVAGATLALYLLLVRRAHLAAGAVLGALVWVRFELAPLALVLGAFHLLVERRPRVVLGMALFPLAYALAGALYHRDPAWFSRYPPSLPGAMPGNPAWVAQHANHTLAGAVDTLLAVTPAAGLALLARPRAAVERAFAAFVALYLLAIMALPAWEVFNFGTAPRYSLQCLPFVALLAGRAADAWWDDAPHPPHEGDARRETPVLAALLALALVAHARSGATLPLWSVAALAAAVALRLAGLGALALAPALALLVGGAWNARGVEIDRATHAAHLEPLTAWLRAHRAEVGRRPVFTNAPLLATYLARSGALPGVSVRYIVQADQLYEVAHLANPHNGQRAAVRHLVARVFYGAAVFPEDLAPERVPPGALFALTDDPRLGMVLPDAAWRPRLRVLHAGRGFTVAELR